MTDTNLSTTPPSALAADGVEADLLDNYQKAYGGCVGFGRRPALILIDFARGYFDPACDLYLGDDACLSSALRLRRLARRKGVPVILTRVRYQDKGVDGGRFFQKARPLRYFLEGDKMGGWAEGLRPLSGELVITKQYPSAFFATSLASTLTALGVDNAILTGVSTSGCVRATCVDAMSHGFITTVVRDAVGDRHPQPHEANLFDMHAKYADVVDEAAVAAFFEALPAASAR
jgi:maleamate amidohydrolase